MFQVASADGFSEANLQRNFDDGLTKDGSGTYTAPFSGRKTVANTGRRPGSVLENWIVCLRSDVGPKGERKLDLARHKRRAKSGGLSHRLMQQDLTGEFDPGSERTLAARLTHASRTRKGFGPGKVAHG